MLYLLAALVFLLLATSLVLTLNPVFGAYPKGERLARIQRAENTQKRQFQYPVATKVTTSVDLSKFPDFFKKGDTIPDQPLPSLPLDPDAFGSLTADQIFVTWFGHSLLLLEINHKRVLIDPVFSPTPSPFSFASNPAFAMTTEYAVEDLPEIDVVLLSHDHYDHLDYPTILKLRDKVPYFVCSLGVGAHLERWGVSRDKITELNWWMASEVASITFTSTPARHFSGRKIKRYRTLWGGFSIEAAGRKVLYASDSGYGPHFKEIGDQLGPFDLAFLECGQYNEMWHQIHAMPEELPQAWEDVRAKVMMPVHWGRFKLAMHPWTEPVERLLAATSEEKHKQLITPRIGERFDPTGAELPVERWWRGF